MDNRRTTAAVAAGAAALALVGAAIAWQVAEGGDPGTVAQTSASASSSVPPSGSRPTVTSTAVSRTSAPPASATSTGSTPSSTSAGTGEGDPATCSGTEVTALLQRAEELPERTRTVAQTIKEDAQACRTDALVRRATSDQTQLGFGVRSPAQVWALPDDPENRYGWTAVVLGMPWAKVTTNEQTLVVWPRVATEAYADDDAAWQEVVDEGLVSADEAQLMRRAEGYLGYRVGIAEDGRWMFAIAGD